MPDLRSAVRFEEDTVRRAVSGSRVLLTGHTGFKGGWLALWLRRLGAQVVGIALPPPPGPSLHDTIQVDRLLDGRFADIGDPAAFDAALGDFDAEIIFHLAAQAIVRRSIFDPIETFRTNVVGTAVVLEAARRMPSLRSVVVVTSDKCYENREWEWGYRETDPMGGSDPYSASKGCAELVAASYRKTYFSDPAGPRLATVRAGNVIGGGDWAVDRLVPDIVRASLRGEPVQIRNPASVRPWQHVLDALSGYLTVAARLVDGIDAAEAWNFGPDADSVVSVKTLAERIVEAWGPGHPQFTFGDSIGVREARVLALDSAKARSRLGWRPGLDLASAVDLTVGWYRAWSAGNTDMLAFSSEQLAAFNGFVTPYSTTSGNQTSGDLLKCA
jgi:CDP-glucose 4,6-dehydratase